MNTRIQALTAGALAAIAASVAIPALTGAQASPAHSARVAHSRPGASPADQLPAIGVIDYLVFKPSVAGGGAPLGRLGGPALQGELRPRRRREPGDPLGVDHRSFG